MNIGVPNGSNAQGRIIIPLIVGGGPRKKSAGVVETIGSNTGELLDTKKDGMAQKNEFLQFLKQKGSETGILVNFGQFVETYFPYVRFEQRSMPIGKAIEKVYKEYDVHSKMREEYHDAIRSALSDEFDIFYDKNLKIDTLFPFFSMKGFLKQKDTIIAAVCEEGVNSPLESLREQCRLLMDTRFESYITESFSLDAFSAWIDAVDPTSTMKQCFNLPENVNINPEFTKKMIEGIKLFKTDVPTILRTESYDSAIDILRLVIQNRTLIENPSIDGPAIILDIQSVANLCGIFYKGKQNRGFDNISLKEFPSAKFIKTLIEEALAKRTAPLMEARVYRYGKYTHPKNYIHIDHYENPDDPSQECIIIYGNSCFLHGSEVYRVSQIFWNKNTGEIERKHIKYKKFTGSFNRYPVNNLNEYKKMGGDFPDQELLDRTVYYYPRYTIEYEGVAYAGPYEDREGGFYKNLKYILKDVKNDRPLCFSTLVVEGGVVNTKKSVRLSEEEEEAYIRRNSKSE